MNDEERAAGRAKPSSSRSRRATSGKSRARGESGGGSQSERREESRNEPRSDEARGRGDRAEDDRPGIAAAELLKEIRAGLAGADERMAAMADASTARAEARERDATEVADGAADDRELRGLGRRTAEEARAQAREAGSLGQVHRETLALLTEDLERLIQRVGLPPDDTNRKRTVE
jgi:hypothetical protein